MLKQRDLVVGNTRRRAGVFLVAARLPRIPDSDVAWLCRACRTRSWQSSDRSGCKDQAPKPNPWPLLCHRRFSKELGGLTSKRWQTSAQERSEQKSQGHAIDTRLLPSATLCLLDCSQLCHFCLLNTKDQASRHQLSWTQRLRSPRRAASLQLLPAVPGKRRRLGPIGRLKQGNRRSVGLGLSTSGLGAPHRKDSSEWIPLPDLAFWISVSRAAVCAWIRTDRNVRRGREGGGQADPHNKQHREVPIRSNAI